MVSLTYGIQTMAQMNPSMKQKQTHRHREQTHGCHAGRCGGGKDWKFGTSRCKLIYKLVLLLFFGCPVVSDSLWPHELQHIRLLLPSLSPWVCSNSSPLSQWCHPTISSCHPLLLLSSIFPSIRVFSSESALCIRWPKYWSFSFSISPSNEYSGLIPFRIDWYKLIYIQ